MIRTTFLAIATAASALASVSAMAAPGTTRLSAVSAPADGKILRVDQGCGDYAFAGAFSNRSLAVRQASRHGGQVYDLDQSDSANAGRGLWVVARAASSPRQAAAFARQYRQQGVRGAYSGFRCFY